MGAAIDIEKMVREGTLAVDTLEYTFYGIDGPGFELTAAEAACLRRQSGALFRAKRSDKPLHGFWLHIARAVEAGFDTEDAVAHALRDSAVRVNRAIDLMTRQGRLHRDRNRLSLTRKTRAQLEACA